MWLVVVRALVLSHTGDTPARSLLMNLAAHNAECSCQRCEQPGKSRPSCPGVILFPYEPEEMVPRTLEKMELYAKLATAKNSYKGCWGPTSLT